MPPLPAAADPPSDPPPGCAGLPTRAAVCAGLPTRRPGWPAQ